MHALAFAAHPPLRATSPPRRARAPARASSPRPRCAALPARPAAASLPSQNRLTPQHVLPSLATGPGAGPPSPPPRRGRAPDYYANVGSIIEHLRADYPRLFTSSPDLTRYAENILFTERSTGYAVEGKDGYERLMWCVRANSRLFFTKPSIAITSLYHDNDAGVIYLRWRFSAMPRVWGLMRSPPHVVLDAMSVYKINEDGFIAEHCLDNQAPVRPKLRAKIEDILALGTIRLGSPEAVRAGGARNSYFGCDAEENGLDSCFCCHDSLCGTGFVILSSSARRAPSAHIVMNLDSLAL
jgi:hypothetical protein